MMDVLDINESKIIHILNLSEDHFNDLKSKRIAPAKLQETFVAFANSDGGEIYLGVEDKKASGDRIDGFHEPEEANAGDASN
ncbi:ATP-binding protein [Serratia rubidaea]|nr:ATP-binding protein [Serratia rubidaea]